MPVSHSHDKNEIKATTQHKNFDILIFGRKTAQNNLFDSIGSGPGKLETYVLPLGRFRRFLSKK